MGTAADVWGDISVVGSAQYVSVHPQALAALCVAAGLTWRSCSIQYNSQTVGRHFFFLLESVIDIVVDHEI